MKNVRFFNGKLAIFEILETIIRPRLLLIIKNKSHIGF